MQSSTMRCAFVHNDTSVYIWGKKVLGILWFIYPEEVDVYNDEEQHEKTKKYLFLYQRLDLFLCFFLESLFCALGHFSLFLSLNNPV